jgi:hypothetical protein
MPSMPTTSAAFGDLRFVSSGREGVTKPSRFAAGADAVQVFEAKANLLLEQAHAHRGCQNPSRMTYPDSSAHRCKPFEPYRQWKWRRVKRVEPAA